MHTGPSGKKKKISIRFVPNKTASPKTVVYDERNLFPLYVRVIFNQKSNNFPYIHNLPLAQSIYADESLELFYIVNSAGAVVRPILKAQVEADFQSYKDQLTNIISYEYQILGDKQTVKGIYDRFIRYNISLRKVFREETSKQLLDFLEDKLTFRQFKEMQEWERQRTRSNPLLHPDDPLLFISYLQKETVIDLSDLPVSISKSLYSLTLFIQFQENHPQTLFTLYNWLVETEVKKLFVAYLEKKPLIVDPSLTQFPSIPASDVVNCLHGIAMGSIL